MRTMTQAAGVHNLPPHDKEFTLGPAGRGAGRLDFAPPGMLC